MITDKILKLVLLLLAGCYVLSQGFAFEQEGEALGTLMLFLLTVLYCRTTENRINYFFHFLVTFTMAHLISLASYYGPMIGATEMDYYYYSANILYMLAYIFLIIKVLNKLDIQMLFRQFTIPILILVILDIFCVSIITATTETKLTFSEYTLEYAYNAVIMILLSVVLINYMYRNDNKSMLLLIGSIFAVFSEIIQLAYYYILASNDLGFVFSFFHVIGFIFFYMQSQLEFTGPIEAYADEQLKA